MTAKILDIGDAHLLSRVDQTMSRIRARSEEAARWDHHCAGIEQTIVNAVQIGELGLADTLALGLIYQDLVRRGMISVHMPVADDADPGGPA